ncbi:organic solute transporter ostalpha protein (DUF300) [Rhynchospora pubera]|uniref:Organic solute transporter ostalpha protein (DUF300) n=1 Tax=Rhynchospora pubera TaxID=906938 RepID=A0AAV8CIS2_9POAL|nr:organic solute transporter ostalpha protein (DUF300) [Rhynchospora pubera]
MSYYFYWHPFRALIRTTAVSIVSLSLSASGFFKKELIEFEMEINEMSSFQGVYTNLHVPALVIGGVFALNALILSLMLIFRHLRSYTNPYEQKWIIAVLFMVPVYATDSIISLWVSRLSMICDILRSCYEAFALYSFGRYLVACLGGEPRVVDMLENKANEELQEQLLEEGEKKGSRKEGSFCDFFCHPIFLGKDMYTTVKFGLVQYMILKTACAFLSLILELLGVYGEGEFKWYYGYPYIAIVINFSQSWALYCLVQFYHVTRERLQPIRPLEKFISFKAIVFATWWQGLAIAIICYFGILPKAGKIQNTIQNFLICIEMSVASIAHVYVFSAEPYQYLPIASCGSVTLEETKTQVEVKDGKDKKPATVETKENVESPGTSIRESVQDVVLVGGKHVVKDVVLTISQAIEPVEKGVTKIQETMHHISVKPNKESEYAINEHTNERIVDGDTVDVESEIEIRPEGIQK